VAHLVLRKLERFATLSEEDRRTLLAHVRHIQHFNARDDLAKDGDHPRYVNFILEGWACRYKLLEDGRRQIISFFVPGDLCDPIVFLLREMSHGLGSITPVTVARVSREDMLALMAKSPALEKAFWLDMLISAEIQREWTVALGRKTARERMAHLFCELAMRLRAIGLAEGQEFEMPATQTDLADALGLSSVHVSRTLQELRGAGLIELKGKRMTLNNEKALREVAMFDPSYLHLSNIVT
jgi:CRP-like cAMP-binding protein